MNIRNIAGLLFLLIPVFASGQLDKKVLLEINGHEITAGEFRRIYNKNNPETAEHAKDMEAYLDLFINFKLKVIEAEKLGLDTTQAFHDELQHYRNELAKPYLVNEQAIDSMLRAAYQRKKQERNVSHILVKVPDNASANDTALAYEKALRIRERLKNGESFQTVAKESSDDPSARKNGGNLGFIGAFKTVAPFENAVYSLDVGEISQPVRTRFGYHIIKVNAIREAPGKVKVAHIMLASPKGMPQKKQAELKDSIKEIKGLLKEGAEFSELAKKYSADKRSAKQGGELPWFGSGRMVPAFEKAAFGLKEIGDVSEPVKTAFGWHLIKLLDKQGVKDFKDAKNELKNKLQRSGRINSAKLTKVKQLKEEYNYRKTAEINDLYDKVDAAVFKGNWKAPDIQASEQLIAFGDTSFSKEAFLKYIAKNQKQQKKTALKQYVDKQFKEFVNDKILAYEKSRLEEKYPRFRHLMQEYHDGILLFELTDREIWSKAVDDTLGLQNYYEQHKSEYMKPDRVDATLFKYYDDGAFRKLRRYLRRKDRKEYTNADITTMMKEDGYKVNILADTIFSREKNQYVNAVWNGSLSEVEEINALEDEKVIVYVTDKLPARPKKLDEARGMITADYQDFLEKKWVKQLKEKYTINVHEDVLEELQSNTE